MRNETPKLSFTEAALELGRLMNEIDNYDGEIDQAFVKQFKGTLDDTMQSVDRRKAFYRELLSKIEMAKEFKEKISKQIETYQKVKERLIEHTKLIVNAHPDIIFRDSFGKALKVIKNPEPKLIIQTSIDPAAEEYWQPYLRTSSVVELDKDKVKADLLRGDLLPFAHLEYGTQLRGLK